MEAFQPSKDVKASIFFLEELELYSREKPYTLAFNPDDHVQRSNIKHREVSVPIKDMRGATNPFNIETNGFTIVKLPCLPLDLSWDQKQTVRDVHYPQVVKAVQQLFPEARCSPLFHKLRKRDAAFPMSTGENYSFGQPLRGAHVDLVQSTAQQWIKQHLSQKADDVLRGRYMIANVWHPIKGPNDDWPLALCDTSTLEPEQDLEVADYVTEELVGEHCLVYPRDKLQWWYLSSQEVTEAFLFRQFDSQKGVISGVPHAAFENPNNNSAEPRQSIEIIVAVYWP